jgi:phosphoglycerate kinase
LRFLTLRDVDVRGKRVLARLDLNVPLRDGKVGDDTRIIASLATLRHLRAQGAITIVLSHLGRPNGTIVPSLSLSPVAQALSKHMGCAVAFAPECVGPLAQEAIARLGNGDLILLENLRFHPEEEENQPHFAAQLAAFGELYVNDAFGTAHRAHASTEGITHILPAYAGFLMEAELKALDTLTRAPRRPYVCVVGGAKVKEKQELLAGLLRRVNAFIIGGGMANTFLAAQGIDVGTSLRDDDLEPAKHILAAAQERNIPVHLPVDAITSTSFDADDRATATPLANIDTRMILDIGPATAQRYAGILHTAQTIVFNGPMGVYEKAAYQAGTRIVGQAMAQAVRQGAVAVVGGGDAAAAANLLGFASAMTYVSTGGGATLEFLEGKMLPGVAALERFSGSAEQQVFH